MEHDRSSTLTARAWNTHRVVRLAVLFLGPVVSLVLASRIGSGVEKPSIETAVMLLWSPLFFSVPALLMQKERDAAFPLEGNFLLRGMRLVPYLVSRWSPVRVESIISITMWLWLLAVTRDSVAVVLARSVSLLPG